MDNIICKLKIYVFLFLLIMLFIGCGSSNDNNSTSELSLIPSTSSKIIAGYAYYRTRGEDAQTYKDAISNGYNLISISFACLNKDGTIAFSNQYQGNITQEAREYAIENNTKVYLTFGGAGGCPFDITQNNNPDYIILSYLQSLKYYSDKYQKEIDLYDGINLDLEGVEILQQTDATSLDNAKKIANTLRSNGYKIAIAPEYPYVIPVTNLYQKHDPIIYPNNTENIYTALLKKGLIDYMFVQLYNQPGNEPATKWAESYICKNNNSCKASDSDASFTYDNDPGFVKAIHTNMIDYWKDSIDLTTKLIPGFPATDAAYGNGSVWYGMNDPQEIKTELNTIDPIPSGVAVWAIPNDESTDGDNLYYHSLDGLRHTRKSWDFVNNIKDF